MSENNVINDQSDSFLPINTQTWVNGRHKVRCVRVIEETHDVRSFCFMAEQPLIFFFKPGQFVSLELEIDGEPIMRSYSMSSSPSVPYSFSITVKRVPNGKVSNWLHDNMVEGTDIFVHGPVGFFNCIDYPANKVLFLSGGVGITPIISMARWHFDTNADVDMVFVHSARTPSDIIFKRELEHMCSRVPNFALHIICETYSRGQSWDGYRGYLDEQKLNMIAPDFMDREVFCCGPKPYMDAIKQVLKAVGYDMSRYHEESFGEDLTPAVQEAIKEAEADAEELSGIEVKNEFEVVFSKTGKSIAVPAEETVHTAAAKLGIHIPKACGMGICGTCKVMKTDGEVIMEHNGGITDDDVEEGYILSCCSVPKGTVVIDY
ncbi:MAG: hybrid-cluster NAD(P)-dependent oxidoreductase [Reinekea sp.]|jgi:glycine betaine catabolism B